MDKNKYALWLLPSNQDSIPLAETIRRYSQTMSTPMFEPHITLMSRLHGSATELEEKALEIANATDVLHLMLGWPVHSDSYFQCVFLPVEADSSLLEVHVRAYSLFEAGIQKGYSPHLSLVYGSLTARERQRIVAEIGDNLSGPTVFSRMCLYRASSDSPPDTWNEIGNYYLGQEPNPK
jgi:hypothetical protein